MFIQCSDHGHNNTVTDTPTSISPCKIAVSFLLSLTVTLVLRVAIMRFPIALPPGEAHFGDISMRVSHEPRPSLLESTEHTRGEHLLCELDDSGV